MTIVPKDATPTAPPASLSTEEIAAILAGTHSNPFAALGVHPAGKEFIARCFIPGAETVTAETLAGKEIGTLNRRDDAGFFEGPVAVKKIQPVRYRARNAGGEWTVIDPYSFGPVLGPMDD